MDGCTATDFAARLRRRNFGTAPARNNRFVYVPLHGRIAERRSFQSARPLDMLAATLARTAPRPVPASLHPREVYAPADRRDLAKLMAREPRLRLTVRPMADLLRGCSTPDCDGHLYWFFVQNVLNARAADAEAAILARVRRPGVAGLKRERAPGGRPSRPIFRRRIRSIP